MKVWVGIIALLAIVLVAGFSVTINLLHFINDLIAQPLVIQFPKGDLYLLGLIVTGGALVLSLVVEHFFKAFFTRSFVKLVSLIIFSGMALAIILPNAAHFFIAQHMDEQGYFQCDIRSSKNIPKLFITYVKSNEDCH
ncbi:MAG: hypothetical protein CSB47_00835 [Proteobacteria bacterium]|nr:MAG: hypothetical protein CSB47_00835 [Pseudomonadota bacterium]